MNTNCIALDQLSVDEIRAYRQLFDMSGAKDGQITSQQLKEFLNNLGGNFCTGDVDNFYRLLSLSPERPLSFEQFIVLGKMVLLPQDQTTKIKQTLNSLGIHKETKLDANELGVILKETNPNWKQDAADMITFASRANKSFCDYSDLEHLYKQMKSNTATNH